MTVIELADEDAAALKAKATAAGLTLEAWLKELGGTGEQNTPDVQPLRTAADIVLKHMRNIPPEIMATMPEDGASQHDHYIYGWPKKAVSFQLSAFSFQLLAISSGLDSAFETMAAVTRYAGTSLRAFGGSISPVICAPSRRDRRAN